MVKCPECGEVLTESHKLCPVCGYKLSKKDNKDSSTKVSKSNNKILVVIAVIVVIAIVGVLASGMVSTNHSSDDASVSDDSSSSKNVKEDSSSSSSSSEYWASAKADKFHLPTCEWAEKISEDNKIIYQSREDAITDGKEPCGACNP